MDAALGIGGDADTPALVVELVAVELRHVDLRLLARIGRRRNGAVVDRRLAQFHEDF